MFLSSMPPWDSRVCADNGKMINVAWDGRRYFLLASCGVFTNKGESWVRIDIADEEVENAVQLEAENQALYLLKENGACRRSLNAGVAWETVFSPPFLLNDPAGKPQKIYAFEDIVLAVSSKGIYRSKNRGDTWEMATVPHDYYAPEINDLDFVRMKEAWLMSYDNGQMKSTDGGATWHKL
jgi:photosystem II stability/assembly factor-like uncharacterized protein